MGRARGGGETTSTLASGCSLSERGADVWKLRTYAGRMLRAPRARAPPRGTTAILSLVAMRPVFPRLAAWAMDRI